jgi:uncharacterized protein (DUF1501 family)
MTLQSIMHVQTNHDGVISRREFFRNAALATAGVGVLGWRHAVMANAEDMRRQGKACILLFMNGAPSQFETFDPKPGTTNGGPTQAINTAVEGIRIADPWTNVASNMRDIALIRSMTNREGEHQRATYQMHTGYVPAGGVRHPTLGSIVAKEIGPRDFDLPHFVSVGGRFGIGSGFLGASVAPFVVGNPNQMPANAQRSTGISQDRFDRRLNLMNDLEQDFAEAGGAARVQDHRALYTNAANLVRSPRLVAFDLARETAATRDRYGRNAFGQGCLLARRLVEAGVTFVEVGLGGWDTHQDNFNRSKTLSQQADPGFGALVQDLKDRGRLDNTLILWIGEFGRTPRINGNTGRDHYPVAFNAAIAGGGVKGGRVIGSTNANGTSVSNRPVTVPDLLCTVCQSLGINARKENLTPIGRPIRIVDGGAPVRELFA